jgi:hypothetical protein
MAAPLVIDAGTVRQLPAGEPLRIASTLTLPSGAAGDVIYYGVAASLYVHNGTSWGAVGGGGGNAYYDARRAAAHGA